MNRHRYLDWVRLVLCTIYPLTGPDGGNGTHDARWVDACDPTGLGNMNCQGKCLHALHVTADAPIA